VEIGIPLPAGKLGAGSQRRGEQSPAQAQCGSQARSSVCFYIHTMGGNPTVRPGLARVFTTELAVYA
jgi:hypothetical protein